MDRKAIKAKAKEFAFKNKWNLWKPHLALIGITMVLEFIAGFIVGFTGQPADGLLGNVLTSAVTIVTLPMSIGCLSYVMNLMKGKQMTVKEALFGKYNMFVLILLVTLVVYILTFVGTLCFIIPGMIFAYSMVMVNMILAEDGADKLKHSEVTDRSKKLMNGHKMEYFVFGLSFMGWILLSIVTLGIGLIWTLPYMTVAEIMYFEELKKLEASKEA